MKKIAAKQSLRRFTTIGSAIDTLRKKRIAFLDPDKWDDRNDAEFMRLYRNRTRCASLKALCCTESAETYHHWRVFTHSTDGCFIDLQKKALVESVRNNPDYRAQPMEYIRLSEIEDCEYEARDLPFLKRAGFRAEEEYRIIYTGACDDDTHYLEIELSWINRIVLNPWLPATVAESITDTFREISGLPSLRVVASKLTNSQTWLQWGRKMSRRRT
ncbi:hypothetical protein [Sphingopyxis chilensis]|uniref:hypothetical protein n=1 Tax=Sphingopyxis chilensis TaxID=180400 RepID=UPI002DDDBAFF|nr:hypothetical protein [Sphingopyxis chilensis]